MPLYEYTCHDCHVTFDILRPMSQADAPIECTHCHGSNTIRAISLFAAHSLDELGGTQSLSGGNGGCATCGSPSSCSTCGIA
ncbi:MAG: zinc ribbon domain-containing protein [Chloroflexi bacterium]|nr:zinc ribbon domain-containing protein [Chloroflexota bacterium]